MCEEEQQHGGIVNYFQGATIHNLVINGNMTRRGREYYGSEAQAARPPKKDVAGKAQQTGQGTEQCDRWADNDENLESPTININITNNFTGSIEHFHNEE